MAPSDCIGVFLATAPDGILGVREDSDQGMKKVTHEQLMLAVGQSTPRETPEQESTTTKWVVVTGVAGLLGVLALVNYMGNKK